jgi:hypothetical protein
MHLLKKTGSPFLVLLIVLSVIYWPVLVFDYAYHDDYVYFVREAYQFQDWVFFDGEFSNGRYLTSYLQNGLGYVVNRVSDLSFLRFFSVIILSLIGTICFQMIHAVFQNRIHSILAIVSLLTLAPFQVYVSWSMSVGKIPAILFASLAMAVMWHAENQAVYLKAKIHLYRILALLLMLCALSTYQPGAMFYWSLLILVMMIHRKEAYAPTTSLRMDPFFLIGMVSMGLYFLIVSLLKETFGKHTNTLYNPYEISFDIREKISWFIQEPLLNAIHLWNIERSLSFTWLVILVIGIGIMCYLRQHKKSLTLQPPGKAALFNLIIHALLVVVLMLLSFSPNLLARGEAAFYRCCVGLSSAILITVLWSLKHITDIFPAKIKNLLLLGILLLMSLYGIIQAQQQMINLRIMPSQAELSLLKGQLRYADLERIDHIHFLQADPKWYASIKRYDEFGVPSTHYPQDLPLMLKCALREIGQEPRFWQFYPRITHSWVPQPQAERTLVIDLRNLLEFELPGWEIP